MTMPRMRPTIVVVSAVEAQTIDIEEQRDFIHRYQDEVLARL